MICLRMQNISVLRHSGILTMAMMDMAAARPSTVLLKGDWRQSYWMEILDDDILAPLLNYGVEEEVDQC